MKCARCPLYTSWSNESGRGEACGLFGDAWDNPLQYEDKEGAIVGCYVDRHFIERADREYEDHLAQEAAEYEVLMLEKNEQLRKTIDDLNRRIAILLDKRLTI